MHHILYAWYVYIYIYIYIYICLHCSYCVYLSESEISSKKLSISESRFLIKWFILIVWGVSDKDVKEAADCLRKLGHEKKQYRFGGRKPYYWFHPEWSIEQKKKEPRIINLPNKGHYEI